MTFLSIRPTIFNLSVISLLISISVSLLQFKSSINHSCRNETLTLTLTSQNPPSEPEPQETNDRHQQEVTRSSNYIVRFLEYKEAEDHKTYLQENVRLKIWEWVERRNPAAKYPTDFGVISIENDSVRRTELIEELGRLKLVKDVSADFSYQRSLFGKRGRERMGSFVDGRKRPGKIFTSMSFSEGESYVAAATTSNTTISWKRHLLMQSEKKNALYIVQHPKMRLLEYPL